MIVGTAQIIQNMRNFGKAKIDKIKLIMDYSMTEAEGTAKRQAPWTDRTGNARASIYGTIDDSNRKDIIGYLGIQVDYGLFLETANDKRFAIIKPVADVTKTKIAERIRLI